MATAELTVLDGNRPPAAAPGIPKSLLGGGASLAARYALGAVVSMGNMLVLTWWIGPHAYGVFVTAIGLVAFASTLSRVGVDVYLVRRPSTPDRKVYATATTLVLVASAVLVTAAVGLLPALIRWYGSREFALPYMFLLINVPVTGLVGIPTAKLERDLQFNKVAAIELAAQACGFLIALVFALLGAGLWAAVAGQLIWQTVTLFAALRYAELNLRLRCEAGEARAMLKYGLAVTASMRSWQLRTLVNPLLVARFAGAEAVAYVALAIRIAESLGSVRLAGGRLATAALARVQQTREDFRRLLDQALFAQVVTLGPLLVAFALLGPTIVRHVVGARWLPSLSVFPFIAAGVLVNSIFNLQASALFVVGQPWSVMRSFVAHACLLAGATAWLLPRIGIVGYGWAELIACAAYFAIHRSMATKAPVSYRKLLPLTAAFIALLFVPAAKVAWAMPQTERSSRVIPPTFFGMHFRADKISWPTLPFGSLRLWDTDTRRQNLNPAAGIFNFNTLDQYLAAAKQHGVDDVLLTLGGTPAWASAGPTNYGCDYSNIAPGDCGSPADLNLDGSGPNQYWRDFVYALGAHLQRLPPRFAPVTHFSVWNEFTRGRESKKSSWLGTNEQLVRMAIDANCILTGRAIAGQPCDPESMRVPAVGLLPAAKIVSPDAVPVSPDLERLQAYFATRGAIESADIIAIHTYPAGAGTSPELALRQHWDNLQRILPPKAKSLPVWSTEGSWGNTANLPDTDKQMGFIARYYLVGWSLGFDRLYWYAADNSWGRLINQNGIGGCHDFGSHRGCPTQAAVAFQQVYRWMVGNRMTAPCTASATVWTCGLTKSDGTSMLTVWDAAQSCSRGNCTTTAYKYAPEYRRYFTLDGPDARPLSGNTVQIGSKPILLSQ